MEMSQRMAMNGVSTLDMGSKGGTKPETSLEAFLKVKLHLRHWKVSQRLKV